MTMVGISGSLLHGGNTDRPVHSRFDLSLLVQSLRRSRSALPLAGLAIFLLACAWGDAGEQSGPATPANSKAPATSEEPRYLVFWSSPEKAGELAERVGMKGDGKTRFLGFGLPNATYELEKQLPGRIRSAFAAAREHDLSYSKFINGLKKANITLDRKALANLAATNPEAFAELAKIAKEAA